MLSRRVNAGGASAWNYVDKLIHVRWDKPGGDWLDADGVRHGPKPFAVAKRKDVDAATELVEFDVSSLLPHLLRENTGIHMRTVWSGAGWARFASLTHKDHPAPYLVVTRPDGSQIKCPAIFAGQLSASVPEVIVMASNYLTTDNAAAILKFDLSYVDNWQSAKMFITSFAKYSTLAQTPIIGLALLDPPSVIDDPAELGPEVPGEATASDVIFGAHFTSVAQGLADGFFPDAAVKLWGDEVNYQFQPGGKIRIRLHGPQLINDKWFAQNYGSSWRRRLPGYQYATLADNPAPTEAYIAFGLDYPINAGDIEGVKTPGANCVYESLPDMGCSLRTEHGARSAQNPRWLSHFTYAYTPEVYRLGGGSGYNWFSGADRRYVLKAGTTVFVQQHIKLNSFDANGSPVPDSVYELWLDWRLAFQWNKDTDPNWDGILRTDPRVGIRELLQAQIYHGGVAFATHDADYILHPVLACRKFIGRPMYEAFAAAA